MYKEQPAELFHTGVGVQQDFVCVFADLVLGQSNFHLQVGSGNKQTVKTGRQDPSPHSTLCHFDSLERMSLISLLHSLQHRLVDPEANGGRERGQG